VQAWEWETENKALQEKVGEKVEEIEKAENREKEKK
jgi:hypothetical protein